MRYLIFSDIHSNLEALQAVLEDASGRSCDRTICLGDFVGYGASPNECVHTVKSITSAAAVLGNHDAALLSPLERDLFNPVAKAGIEFSERNIDEEGRSFLGGLPMVIKPDDRVLAVHASPYRPDAWIYVIEPIEAADAFHVMDRPAAFIGHTHFPAIHSDNGAVMPFLPGDRIRITENKKCIINVGSVGQPRDGDCRAAYVIYDDEQSIAEIFRVDYDIDTAAQKILDAGLPPMLADRLRRGY